MILQAVTLLFLLPSASSFIQDIGMPQEYRQCYNDLASKTDYTQTVGHLISWHCKTKWTSSHANKTLYNTTYTKGDWFDNLLKSLDLGSCGNSKTSQPRMRQEIRTLSKRQWQKLTRAIQTLKSTKYRDTNRYEYIASYHSGSIVFTAHFGPNFLVWHRLYMLLYENALREIDPTVILPYFDVTIDAEMNDPSSSVLWTEEFMGNANGDVTTGPFKNWQTRHGRLYRNIGEGGQYFTKDFVGRILNRTRLQEISSPTASAEYDLELEHGGPHVYVNGFFGDLQRAAYDPIFFFYHCFIDYIYQKFRDVSENAGIDIENDWTNTFSDLHEPGMTSGFGDIQNIQGRSKYYTDCVYGYQDSPVCSASKTSCSSQYLWCNQTINRCVSFSEDEYFNKSCRGQRQYGFLNSFCIDEYCDINQWVYFPVEVIQLRPPDYGVARTLKVENGTFQHSHDIYESNINGEKRSLATYRKCKTMRANTDVIVESTGLNYVGDYKEVALTDNRLPISKSTIYLAAKRPNHNFNTKVLISAADACGRECKILCRNFYDLYYPCPGMFNITADWPFMYNYTVEKVVLDTWNQIAWKTQQNFKIKVLCDYADTSPRLDYIQ